MYNRQTLRILTWYYQGGGIVIADDVYFMGSWTRITLFMPYIFPDDIMDADFNDDLVAGVEDLVYNGT